MIIILEFFFVVDLFFVVVVTNYRITTTTVLVVKQQKRKPHCIMLHWLIPFDHTMRELLVAIPSATERLLILT